MNCHEAARLVDAYLDGELTGDQAASVERHLGVCGACDRLATERRMLSRLIQAAPYYEAPERVRARVAALAGRSRWPIGSLALAASLVLAATLGGATIVRRIGDARATRAVVQDVVDAHVRALREQRLVSVMSTDQHTVKPWFLGKLDFTPPVADFAAGGFPLAGGRIERIEGRPVAVLVYQRRLHPIAVFVWPAEDGRAVASTAESLRGFHVRHWTRDGMSFWAVSDLGDAELDQFAAAVQSR